MTRAARLLLMCVFLPVLLRSQTGAVPPEALRTYAEAGKWFTTVQSSVDNDRRALALFRKTILLLASSKTGNPILVDCYTKCGLLEMTTGTEESGGPDFQQAVTAGRSFPAGKDSLLFQAYLYLGSIAYGKSDLDSARYYYRLAEDIQDRYPGVEGASRLFNKFGALYYETGDYNQSIHYFEKALEAADPRSAAYFSFTVNYKNNIATALLKLGRYDEALDLLQSLLKYHLSQDGLLMNMGIASMGKKDFPGALRFFRAVGKDNAARCNAMAQVFTELGMKDSAIRYLEHAQQPGHFSPAFIPEVDAAITQQTLADLYRTGTSAGDKEKAARHFQQAIRLLDPQFTDTLLSANPGGFAGLQDFGHLFESLDGKAAVLSERSLLPGGAPFLPWALDTYVSALSLARHIERTYFSDDARLFLKNQVNPAIAQAITVALRLYHSSGEDKYLDLAFGFSETSKASVLQAGLRDLSLSSIPGLPQSLLQEEKKLKFLQARLSLAAAGESDPGPLGRIRAKIRDNAIALTAVQEKMDATPAYHQLKYFSNSITLAALVAKLKDDEAILSYYYTTDSLLCFYATHNGHGYTAVATDSQFFAEIRQLRNALESPGLLGRQTMTSIAAALSRVLIQPVLPQVRSKRKWTVIPFNETGYIPFELLPLPGEEKQCLYSHSISYQYSAAILSDSPSILNKHYQVFSMAPFAAQGNVDLAFPALPASADEVRDLPGLSMAGKQATKAAFLARAGGYPVVHLATHAVASDNDALGSYIAFYGLKKDPDSVYRMYEQEVYALDLKQVGIIILSACETGKGQLVNGEGILSLSRAFSYAGCRRVITSLWKADDRSTAMIMSRLHYYLRQGREVDEALQMAKTDYLEDPSVAPNFKTPFYWAHLVLIGERFPLVPKSYPWLLWIVGAGLFLSLLTFLFLYRKKARQKEFRPAMDMKRIRITDEE